MTSRIALAASLAALVSLVCSTTAGDWTQFRGPDATGVAESTNVPEEWGADKNIQWKVELPGVAWSQPIILGDKIFVTTAVTENQQKPRPGFFGGRGGPGGGPPGGGFGPPGGRPEGGRDGARPEGGREGARPEGDRREGAPPPREGDAPRREGDRGAEGQRRPGGFGQGGFGGRPGGGFGGFGRGGPPPNDVYQFKVVCLDRKTGDVVWEKLAKEAKPTIPTHRTNTYASETPITDGERLYAYFGMTGLYCYDLNGKLIWSKELGTYPMMAGWGTGSSCALEGDRLFVLCDNEEKSFLVALDKKTGDELWRVDRDEKSNWCTPYIWKNKTRTEVVTSGKVVRSYDPASGKVLWEMDGHNSGARSTPVGNEEMLFVGTGGGMGGNGPLVAIKAGAKGDITLEGNDTSSTFVAWSVPRAGAPMASPLLYQGYLYVADQRGGILACYDAATGKQHYKERVPDSKGFTSSPWAAGGKVFCLDEEGTTFVIEPGPTLKVVGTNKLNEMFWSSAALADNQLLLRGTDHLYSIAE